MTVGEARARLNLALSHGGAVCPVCDRFATIRTGHLYGAMVRVLFDLYFYDRENHGRFVPVLRTILVGRGRYNSDWPALRHWGLIEERVGTKPDGNPRTGDYRITRTGVEFVEARCRVPRFTYTYNDRCVGVSFETINVREVVRRTFNYDEMIRGRRSA